MLSGTTVIALALMTSPKAASGSSLEQTLNPQDLACDAEPDLMGLVACVKASIPLEDTELYLRPLSAQSQDFAFVVEQMMTDMDDGTFDCDAVVPAGLAAHYRVSVIASGGRETCVLHEFLDADLDGYADLGWGAFFYAPDAALELHIQAPHIRADLQTETEAVDLFERTYSRSALIAGAHRYANSTPSPCQGHLVDGGGDPYVEADAAHDVAAFYAAGKAVADYYGIQDVGGVADLGGVHPDFHVLQLHGMGTSSCAGDHVFLSNGDGSAVSVGDGAERLATALQLHNPSWSVAYRGDGVSSCNLYGRKNTLSRWINGVADNGEDGIDNPICGHEGNHPAVSTRFIHIEQKRCLVGTSCSYGDLDDVRTAEHWAQAVIDAFSGPSCVDGILNGTETGIDCGGSCPLPCFTCIDGLQDGDEEGIDCGGSCPEPCNPGVCLLPGEGLGCDDATPCCSGTGNCANGRPSQRTCQ